MQRHDQYEVGIYCRLSRDDNKGQESMSITNQRQMLMEYVNEKGWRVKETYIDDGISGTGFDRPDFQRMLSDAERGYINCIVTKDLSRLGRNYIQSGYYIEEYFPEHDIRFIAINDGVDTFGEQNDIVPFQNILNEFYPKEISKKVKQVKQAGARQGKFMNSKAPLGFIKDPLDKHKLIRDESAAKVIERMFRMYANGDSARSIAEAFNREGVLSPRAYYYQQTGKSNPNPTESTTWCSNTIYQLLRNQAYIGNMVHSKRKVVSFKSKKRRKTDPSEWIVVEGTHEPLIERKLWDAVQQRMKTNTKVRSGGPKQTGLFSGLVRCADCGSVLTFGAKPRKDGALNLYKCSRYSNHGKSACTVHFITEDVLCQLVLDDLHRYGRLSQEDEQMVIDGVLQMLNSNHSRDLELYEKQIRQAEQRRAVVLQSVRQLFEEKCNNSLPDNLYRELMQGYDHEQVELEQQIIDAKEKAERLLRSADDVANWLELIKKHLHIRELDRATVHELIESIAVSERYDIDGEVRQDVQIFYRFIGQIGKLPNKKQPRESSAGTDKALDCSLVSQVG